MLAKKLYEDNCSSKSFWEVENLSAYDAGGDTVTRSDYPD